MDLKCENAACGKPIIYSGRGRPPSKFCSRACKEICRSAAQHAGVLEKRAEQRCLQCGGPIPLESGSRVKTCSPKCGVDWQNARKAEAKREAKHAIWLATQPVCQRDQCSDVIPESRPLYAKYCSPACKKKVTDARWRASAPGYNRLYNYGITPEQWDAQMAAQEGRCAICQSDKWPGKDDKPHADHDHRIAVFTLRGILCGNCNIGIGLFDDDPLRLASAIVYLTRDNPDALRAAITRLQERLIPVPAA